MEIGMSGFESVDIEQAVLERDFAALNVISEALATRVRTLMKESAKEDDIVMSKWLRDAADACTLGIELLERVSRVVSD